ncbi:54S ribosomal protein L33, mitochondrial [Grifola frondosa]|uniref:Large ribosomal subunit protein uL30m n=1 Tax=Grifola frondosa TaxID=5627 RepID=A0A1C7M6K8_GRIFR|nr:54S ribosomal protein L33, mitochondrial [Grifola frondosa]
MLLNALPMRACAPARSALEFTRLFATATPSSEVSSTSSQPEPNTHFRITLRRSAISLPANIKGTLVALGIHRRMQTVYHRHTPDIAGKILRVKELVEVENVPESAVRTKLEQRIERKAPRGYIVARSKFGQLDI